MPIYSYSRLNTYESCPLKYRYSYIDKLEKVQSIEAFMGNRVHEVLEKLYENQMISKKNELKDLLEHYEKIWDENYSDEIKIIRTEYTADNYRDTGRKCIVDYYKRYEPFDETKTLGLEREISIDIGPYNLKGFIDRISQREDGTHEIHDYKSSRYLPSQNEIDSDKQLGLYQIGIENLWPDVFDIDLVWHFLAHDKEMRSKRDTSHLETLKGEIIELIGNIEKAEEINDFPPVESGLCPWCDYQSFCPSHKHIIATNEMTTEAFLSDDGVSLVNKYVEKKAIQDSIEREIEELKKALIAYSKKEEVEVIRGSEKKLRVKTGLKQKFPGKNEIDRLYLEKLIKSAQKWEEVSALDTNALAKAIDNKEWDLDLIEKVKKYLSWEESYRLTLSTIKEHDE